MEIENKQSLGPRRFSSAYVFEGERGKRDSIIVVAQLCPEFTGSPGRIAGANWKNRSVKPMSRNSKMVAAMALEAVRQQKRITQVEEKVSHVAETVEQIKKGTIREAMPDIAN